jgi:uncharacterized membrane protein/nitrite reductase/ring-hydroxylating ferredoxin subunit
MRSTAQIKGHPIHPILICFPIAFFIGTLVFDLIGHLHNDDRFRIVGYYLNIAGIIGALLAAVPGIIDYFATVPPESSAKKRAATHGLINITNVVVFVIAWMLKRNGATKEVVILVLETAGVILLFIAGWMGGTLVYRNQIGVDLRYAEAGKWKEEHIEQTSGRVKVATSDELAINQMKLLQINKKRIVIGKTENGYAAFDDRCTHKGGSLAGGAMICGTVQCPWHGSQFSVIDGMAKAGPAKEKINTYQVIESGGNIYLDL